MPAYKYVLKDGKTTKWYANFYYTDWTGAKRHACKRGFATQREAKEYEKHFLGNLDKSLDVLFEDMIAAYMKDMEHRLKPTTMESKRHIIDKKITPYLGKLKLCDIDTITIRNWQNELMSSKNNYSPTYLKTINNQLSAIFNYACRHYGLLRNPCHVAGSIGKSKAEEMSIWTRETFTAVMANEKKTNYRVALNILFYAGIREGELLALTPADILPDMKININKSFAIVNGKWLVHDPKTPKSKRMVAIPQFLYDEITDYVGKLYGIKDDERIFTFTKSGLNAELKRLYSLAGVDPIRVHDLRHSHASMLINMGVSIFEISRRLGHESVKTTMDTYGHLYPDKDVNLASRINDLFSENGGTPVLTSP